MNIGIVGLGIVGKSVKLAFGPKCNLFVNDAIKSKDASHIKEELVQNCEIIFVSVPTPFNPLENKVDSSVVDEVIQELNSLSFEKNKKPIIVVKSAIVPRVVKVWEDQCREIDIVISPEYLTEKNHYHDFVNQKVMILGGKKEVCERVKQIYLEYSICNRACKMPICTAQEAALVKYMENSFLAMKCIFNNQYKSFYDKYFDTENNDKFNKLLEVFYTDERMGLFPFKYTVPGPDGDYGYGGKCLPKDTNAIIAEGDRQGTELSLLKKVTEINDEIRTDRDWERIKGALS